MKNITKLLTGPAVIAAALALAACQTVFNESADYKFELVGKPVANGGGTTVSVRLARTDESPVAGAQLYVVRWRYAGSKATPSEQLSPLQPGTQGNFTYSSGSLHAGDTLRLAARIAPDGALIHGSVEVR